MRKIKQVIGTAAVTGTLLASLAMPAFAVSDNANQNACFGQRRAG